MKTNNKTTFLLLLLLTTMFVLPQAQAYVRLDNLYTDPAIISAGEEVDIVVQYENVVTSAEEFYLNDPDYTFKVTLLADDDVTKEHIRILDSQGDDVGSSVYAGNRYNKIYRIKVLDQAPTGTYEFRLFGDWYYKGEPVGVSRDETFTLDIKKDAIDIGVTTISTTPATIRPGDTGVELHLFLENTGSKSAESMEIQLHLPEGITPSYSNNNRQWVGLLSSDSSKEVSFAIDISPELEGTLHELEYELSYQDEDDTNYGTQGSFPLYVKEKAQLELSQESQSVAAGGASTLTLTVTNVGSATAEHIDVRILKQSSQPFTFASRSEYVGMLEPGESATVVFDVSAGRSAQEQEYLFDVIIRSKGDSDQGDEAIYTFNRKASIVVDGKKTNLLIYIGAGLLVLLLILWRLRK